MTKAMPLTVGGLRSKIEARRERASKRMTLSGLKGLTMDFRDDWRRVEVYDWVLRCLDSIEAHSLTLIEPERRCTCGSVTESGDDRYGLATNKPRLVGSEIHYFDKPCEFTPELGFEVGDTVEASGVRAKVGSPQSATTPTTSTSRTTSRTRTVTSWLGS